MARGTSKPAQLALYRRRLHSIHRIPLYVRFKSEVWAAHPYHFILRINPGAEPSTTCRFITGRGTLHNETTPVPYVSPPGLTQTSARWTACHCDEMKASLFLNYCIPNKSSGHTIPQILVGPHASGPPGRSAPARAATWHTTTGLAAHRALPALGPARRLCPGLALHQGPARLPCGPASATAPPQ